MALSCVVQEGKDGINSLEVLLFKYFFFFEEAKLAHLN